MRIFYVFVLIFVFVLRFHGLLTIRVIKEHPPMCSMFWEPAVYSAVCTCNRGIFAHL